MRMLLFTPFYLSLRIFVAFAQFLVFHLVLCEYSDASEFFPFESQFLLHSRVAHSCMTLNLEEYINTRR